MARTTAVHQHPHNLPAVALLQANLRRQGDERRQDGQGLQHRGRLRAASCAGAARRMLSSGGASGRGGACRGAGRAHSCTPGDQTSFPHGCDAYREHYSRGGGCRKRIKGAALMGMAATAKRTWQRRRGCLCLHCGAIAISFLHSVRSLQHPPSSGPLTADRAGTTSTPPLRAPPAWRGAQKAAQSRRKTCRTVPQRSSSSGRRATPPSRS